MGINKSRVVRLIVSICYRDEKSKLHYFFIIMAKSAENQSKSFEVAHY
tara:strand:+ start:285 stop:428 length:144 start_codon:yes stop_codon:yes gene_type:complete